jgi:peptidyl-prolyl cis-trans isomerase A (cyclophilin A)
MIVGVHLLVLALAAAAAAPSTAAHPRVTLETTKGKIVVELYPDKAPKTVANFLDYVKSHQYDGTIFHRVIPGFMIQGGGFVTGMQQKPTKAPIVNESTNGLSNERGTIAMARTGDPNSATAQFFINLVDNKNLDGHPGNPGYAVFGKVVDGMSVVDRIASVPTGSSGMFQDVPREPITITKATVNGAAK